MGKSIFKHPSWLAGLILLMMSTTGWAQDSDAPVASESASSRAPSAAQSSAWSARNLTPFRKQLLVLAGPTSVQSLTVYPREFGFSQRFFFRDRDQTALPNTVIDSQIPIGIAYAPINNLEVGAALPIALDNSFSHLPVWLTYQFIDGAFQLGVRHAFYVPLQTGSAFGYQLSVPMMIRTGFLRMETAAAFDFFSSSPFTFRFSVPFRLGFQITPAWYAGFQTGVQVAKTGNVDPLFVMPLYGFVGHTITTKGTPVDISLRVGFDNFVNVNSTTPAAVTARHFSLAAGLNFGFELGR